MELDPQQDWTKWVHQLGSTCSGRKTKLGSTYSYSRLEVESMLVDNSSIFMGNKAQAIRGRNLDNFWKLIYNGKMEKDHPEDECGRYLHFGVCNHLKSNSCLLHFFYPKN